MNLLGLPFDFGFVGPGRTTSPEIVPNLAMWLRADLNVTQSGGFVSAWGDISGHGIVASQSTGVNQPAIVASGQNSKPTLRGQTNRSRLDLSGTSVPASAGTLILVASPTANATAYLLSGTDGNMAVIENFSGSLVEWFNGNGTDRLTFVSAPAAGLHIFTVTQTNGGQLTGYYDGAQVFSKGTASANWEALGAIFDVVGAGFNGTDGDIPEVLFYNAVLSTSQLRTVHHYLGARYAITVP